MSKENNIIFPSKIKTKKSGKKPVRRKKIEQFIFKLSDDLNLAPAGPAAGKLKAESVAVKVGDSKKIYRRLAFSFIALTLILAAAVLYFGLVKLTIIIIPAKEKITDNSTLEIIRQTSGSNLAPEQIYGVVKQVPVEQSREFSASGQEILGQEVAGQVTIINNYVKNQPLVATTRLLSSDNKLFRLKNTVNVPAGGRVQAEVYADVAKPEMAVGPDKFSLPGLWAGLQDKIYAQSQAPMKYSQKIKYNIEQNDIDKAVKELKNDLLANAKNQVKAAYQNYAQVLFAVDNNSVSQELNGKVGEAKEKFSLKMKIMVNVVAFNDDEIYDKIKAKLAVELADDKEIAKFDKQDMSYALESFNIMPGVAMVKVDSIAQAVLKDGAKAIKKNNLTGLNYEQLRAYLNSLPEVAGYQIKFFPTLVKKAPNLVDRINIEIKK